jgi:transglutaminase-like putative cysteine protease
MLLLFVHPLQEVEQITLSLPISEPPLFSYYRNANFSQAITVKNRELQAEIRNINFSELDFNFRIILDQNFLKDLDEETRFTIRNLYKKTFLFEHYFKKLSDFLKGNIRYNVDGKLPQDARSVLITRTANCIGYANLAGFLLQSVGVKTRIVKGFYLKNGPGQNLVPEPHRWLEIQLEKGDYFFYDPQRQMFSAHYLVTGDDVDFKQIKKFVIHLKEKSKKLVN